MREAVLPPSHIQLGSERPGGTRLIEAMRSALVEVPPERLAGVVLLTDGQVHDVAGRPAAGAGRRAAACADRRQEERARPPDRDRAVAALRRGRPRGDDEVPDRGSRRRHRAGDRCRSAARWCAASTYRSAARSSCRSPSAIPAPTSSSSRSRPAANELTLDNNRAIFTINGVRDRLRVLLVSGEPYQGERAWRNLLKSDPAVDLVHFTILRTPQKDDFTPVRELSLIVFPMRELFEQKLKEFDLIIFDRYESGNLITRDYFRNIAEYVKNGGALLVSVGPVFATARSLYRTPLGADPAGRPAGRRARDRLQAQGHRDRPAPSRHREPAAGRRARQGAAVGPLVPPGHLAHRRTATRSCPVPRTSPWSCSTASARAASPSCCPITCGCGTAASTAAGRSPSWCAGSRTG